MGRAVLFSKFLVVLSLIIHFHPGALAQDKSASAPSSGRNKIEELFIWKISDELKLSAKEEKQFTDLFKELNIRKSEITRAQDEIITQLAQTRQDKERTRLLSQYRKAIDDYNKIQSREFDEMKKMVGPARLSKYLQVKRDLTNKVKNLLTEKTDKKESDLPPPKVIEE